MMMRTFFAAAVLLVSASCHADSQDVEEIQAAFSTYRSALLSRDGEAARTVISQNTTDYYAQMRDLTLDADHEIIVARPILDRLMIYILRARMNAEDLSEMSGGDVFVHAVNEGWVSADTVQSASLGCVEFRSGYVHSCLIIDGEELPLGFRFYLENEQWKLDLSSTFLPVNAAFTQLISDSGLSEDHFLDGLMRSLGYSGGYDDQLRQPLRSVSPGTE